MHISDLHYSLEKSPKGDASRTAAKAILELAESLVKKKVLSLTSCLFITGDLIQSGEVSDGRDDFEAVYTHFLHPLMGILNISSSDVFIVPGNHELDRSSQKDNEHITVEHSLYGMPSPLAPETKIKISEAILDDDLRVKLKNYFSFVEKYKFNSPTKDEPRISVFERDDVQVACFNGLVGSYSRQGNKDKGELFVLDTEFGGRLSAIGNRSIVLTHYPLSWFRDKCSSDLKNFLANRNVKLLSGHIHEKAAEWAETDAGNISIIQAGVSGETGVRTEVAVLWAPNSDSVAVRHFSYEKLKGKFILSGVDQTRVMPEKAQGFFERTEAFFDIDEVSLAREKAANKAASELRISFGRDPEKFIAPDLSIFTESVFGRDKVSIAQFENNYKNKVLSGDELSGKTCFLNWGAYQGNISSSDVRLHLTLDFRSFVGISSLEGFVCKKLLEFGFSNDRAKFILESNLACLWIDNFSAEESASLTHFEKFIRDHEGVQWIIAPKGGRIFSHANAPVSLPKDQVSFYELSEITLPTAMKTIEMHAGLGGVTNPRAVVENVFRSIQNLRAPRTIFYVDSLVDIYLTGAAVEPLNRYLLIENLLSDRIRNAHINRFPGQPVDMKMLEIFIGELAYHILTSDDLFLSKANYYTIAGDFSKRKGLRQKEFEPTEILGVLTDSFVLREYENGYAFMMLSVEDYFLAKHMTKDNEFKNYVISEDGLLKYPSIAEYYIAQNPSDSDRIDDIFKIIDKFVSETQPVIEGMSEITRDLIQTAAPGKIADVKDSIIDSLAAINDPTSKRIIVSEAPKVSGANHRLSFSVQERGAILMQLGASILGVTRTLDIPERIEIFKKLKGLLSVTTNTLPLVAQHLANGGVITFRGTDVRAEYVGDLKVNEDRFYIILRGMLYNLYKNFATWAGSPSFYNASLELRFDEEDELIRAALFAQLIEADLESAIDSIEDITSDLDSLVIKEVTLRAYIDAMTLVPLEKPDETRAIDNIVDVTIELNPPDKKPTEMMLNVRKTKLRVDLMNRIGVNRYIGKVLRKRRKKISKN